MPRCPGCYRILPHRRLDTHLRWCCESTERVRDPGDELYRLARKLNALEHRIERRIDALEADLDRRGSRLDDDAPSPSDPTPPPT